MNIRVGVPARGGGEMLSDYIVTKHDSVIFIHKWRRLLVGGDFTG